MIAISRGRAGRPQRLTVTLREELRRTYLTADVPALRARRPRDYAALVDEGLQETYLTAAPPFRYNDHADRLVAD